MKALFAALVLCCQTNLIQAAGPTPAIPVGCVVFKRVSDAGARFAEYRSFKDFGTTIVVIDGAGDELRLFGGQGAIFIPYPSDKAADRQKTLSLLQLARKTYPDLSRRLALVEKAWVEAPVRTAPAPAVPQASIAVGGTEIVTTNGTRYSNARVTSVDGDVLTIAHDAGVARVRLMDLPDNERKKYATAATRAVGTPTAAIRPVTSAQPSNPVNAPVQPTADGNVPEGTLIPSLVTNPYFNRSESHLLALGRSQDDLVFAGSLILISINHPGVFKASRSDIKPTNLNLGDRVEFDALEHKLASLMCDWSDNIAVVGDEARKQWDDDLIKAPILADSWKEECKRHLALIAEYENMERVDDRAFIVVQKLDDNLYEASFGNGAGGGNIRFVLKTTRTIFKSEGKAHLPMKFVKDEPVALKNGFERRFSIFEEADDSEVKRVCSELGKSSIKIAAMIKSHSIPKNDLADFSEKLLAVGMKSKERHAHIRSEKNYVWNPRLSGFLLEYAFIELLRDRLPKAK